MHGVNRRAYQEKLVVRTKDGLDSTESRHVDHAVREHRTAPGEQRLTNCTWIVSWLSRHGSPLNEAIAAIPESTPVKTLAQRLDTDEYIVVVDVFMPTYRYARENKATKVTTTIPLRMKTEADHLNLNDSDLLKEAIREKLGDLPRI